MMNLTEKGTVLIWEFSKNTVMVLLGVEESYEI
jgi:hypothetical protein